MVPVAPLDRNGRLAGSTAKLQGTAACWTSDTLALPTVIVARRSAPALALTLILTDPLPRPDAPSVMVARSAPEATAAVQVHSLLAVTVIVRSPPPASTVALVGSTPSHGPRGVGGEGVLGSRDET